MITSWRLRLQARQSIPRLERQGLSHTPDIDLLSWSGFGITFYVTKFTIITNWCYIDDMKRATMTLTDDLADALETYVRAQEVRPTLTAVVQVALREYLAERGFLKVDRSLKVSPARRGSGSRDGSREHDRYLAKKQK
jgi:hypothetical protein